VYRAKQYLGFHNRYGGCDKSRKKKTHDKPAQGFDKPPGDLYFKANQAVFTGGDAPAPGVDMLMVVFYNDKNARKNDGQDQPCGHESGNKGSFSQSHHHIECSMRFFSAFRKPYFQFHRGRLTNFPDGHKIY
jgi:hypothetical protein